MATFKRLRTSSVAPEPPASVILLDLVVSPTPRAVGALTPAQRQVWHELRRQLFRAVDGHPDFDPRVVLGLSHEELPEWRERRRTWAAEYFRNDPRVACDA